MLDRLHTHLVMLRRDGTIAQWYDRDIMAGGDIDKEVTNELSQCQLFLALASPDFLNSQYCYETEMTKALLRHDAGEITIVPIILEPCDWLSSPLARFKALPRDGKAISEWPNQNLAFLDVVNELRRLASSARSAKPTNSGLSSSTSKPNALAKYRVKRAFDQIDRDDFRTHAYEVIRDHFEKSTRELDGGEDIRGRYQSMGPVSFTCTIVNHMMKNSRSGTASITVHAGGRSGLGDIYFSHEANSPGNTANGSFRIDADDYHLYLRADFFDISDSKRTWSPIEAANRLWQEFIGRAGITYG